MTSFEHFVTNVNRTLKRNIVARGSEILQVPRFDSGSVSLNVELGGGVPEGRIITLAGLDSDGKSSTALMMAAGFQKKYPNKVVFWLDAEGAWDDSWSTAIGIDAKKVWVARPEYAEQGYQIALEALKTDDIGLVVIDSVAAMTPKAEAEGDMEDVQVALQARLNKRFLRKAQRILLETDKDVVPTIVVVNQLTTNIGGYGNPEIEGGGKGLRYYPSVKIMLKKGDLFDGRKTYKYVGVNDEGVEIVAQEIKFYIEKNKTAPPKRRGHFWFYVDKLDDLRPQGSVDKLEEIIRYSKKFDIVKQRGSMFDLPNPATGEVMSFKGSGALADYIRANDAIKSWIVDEVLRRVNKLHEGEAVSIDEEAKEPEGADTSDDEIFSEIDLSEVGDDDRKRDKSSQEDRSKAAA